MATGYEVRACDNSFWSIDVLSLWTYTVLSEDDRTNGASRLNNRCTNVHSSGPEEHVQNDLDRSTSEHPKIAILLHEFGLFYLLDAQLICYENYTYEPCVQDGFRKCQQSVSIRTIAFLHSYETRGLLLYINAE